MLNLIDTHCHLHDSEFFPGDAAESALKSARERGVTEIICIGTDHEDSLAAADFATSHNGVYYTYGIHPEYAVDPRPSDFKLPDHPPVAIGEVGLDYHYSPETREEQISLLEKMLQLALDRHLPVSLHVREAFSDLFGILDNFPGLTGVVHSFTGSKRDLAESLRRGFYIGVNGLATYTTIPLPPLDRMLLETDAPFLTPVPIRGTMNVPGNVRIIAEYLSAHLGLELDLIAEQTTKNGKQLFHL